MKEVISRSAIVLLAFFSSCTDQTVSTDVITGRQTGKVDLSFAKAPANVAEVIATLSREGYSDRILQMTISDSTHSASGSITNVAVGTWHLKVDAVNDSGVVQYTGETDVDVLPGQTTHVSLELLPTTGNIEIVVTWGTGCTAPPSGLVSWWAGDGNANDLVGGNNGILYNGTSFVSGHVGGAFSFDGVNDRVFVPDADNLKLTGSLTIETWINVSAIPQIQGNYVFFRGDDRPALDPIGMGIGPDGTIGFTIESLTSTVTIHAPISVGQFVHIAATLDSVTGAMKLYVNGVVAADTTTTVRPFRDLDTNYNPGLGIGNTQGDQFNYPFYGLIDELSIYNRSLSIAEIGAIVNAGRIGKCK